MEIFDFFKNVILLNSKEFSTKMVKKGYSLQVYWDKKRTKYDFHY